MKRLCLILSLAAFSVMAFAQTIDPIQVVKDISTYRAQKVKEARDAKTPLDAEKLSKECIAKAEEALKGVDLTKIEAAKALDWARVTVLANRDKDTCDLCQKYLTSNPDPKMKFAAQNLMLTACERLGEGDMLAMMLPMVEPDTKQAAATIAILTANTYSDTISSKKGGGEALKVLDAVEKKINYADFTTPEEKSLADNARGSIATAKAQFFMEQKKKDQAIATLDAALKELTPDGPMAKRIASSRTQFAILDTLSPALEAEKMYGEYKSIEALKGKVVILDFFAHWCGPCIRSFPDMKALYDANKDKGLEMIGVTTYYGYYKDENREKRDMAKDVEFAKMADFMKEHNMNWPVVYTARESYAPFGVSGIPHVVVIGRDGRVHKVKVGYSPATFKAFKEEIEKLLKE